MKDKKRTSLVSNAIIKLTDREVWKATVETQIMQRESIEQVAEDFKDRH